MLNAMRNFSLVSDQRNILSDEEVMKMIEEEVNNLLDVEIQPYQLRLTKTNRLNRALQKSVVKMRENKKNQPMFINLQQAIADAIGNAQQSQQATQQSTPITPQVDQTVMTVERAGAVDGNFSVSNMMSQLTQSTQSTQPVQAKQEGQQKYIYTCPKCNAKLVNGWTEYEDHVIKHCIKPFPCPYCGDGYKQAGLRAHVRACSSNLNKPNK